MKLSLLGTGLMGYPMAERLLGQGVELTVWNRTAAAAQPLAARGAHLAATAAAALAAAPATIVMLRDAAAVREVLFADRGAALHGRAVIQMSTIGPRESAALHDEVAALGGDYLEAPVMGGINLARDGKLQVMVGASAEQFARWSAALEAFGSVQRIGEVGQAAALKVALNQLIPALTTGFSLSLGIVRRRGIDIDLFMDILRRSAFYAPTFDVRLQRLRERDYANPNFPLELLLKDVDLAAAEGRALGLDTTALAGIRAAVAKGVEAGRGRDDYAALYEAIDPDDAAD